MQSIPNYVPVLPGMKEEEIRMIGNIGYWVGSVTPKRAEQWLKLFNSEENPDLVQRPQLEISVQALKEQIAAGKWKEEVPDHLAVTKGEHPYFLNGVSRLTAISEGRKSAVLRIMLGVSSEIFLYTDTGRSTTPSEALKAIHPEALYPQTLAGAIRFIINYREKRFFEMVRPQRFIIPIDEIVKFYEQNPLIQELTVEAHKLYRETETQDQIITQRIIAGLLFIAINDCKHPAVRAKEYFKKLLLPTTQAEHHDISTSILKGLGSVRMSELIAKEYLRRVGALIKGFNAFMKYQKGSSYMINLNVSLNSFPTIEEAPRDLIKELA